LLFGILLSLMANSAMRRKRSKAGSLRFHFAFPLTQ
jgi:hypothetical protein